MASDMEGPAPGPTLNLVYNPQGAVLPPSQTSLESDYRHRLSEAFGIVFNHLYVLTNMPIQRFGSTLVSKGLFDEYMTLLKSAYQPSNVETLMCRSLLRSTGRATSTIAISTRCSGSR